MKFTTRVKNAFTAFSGNKATNSITNEAADFLRYGNKNRPLLQDWSQVEMSDQDMYTGYSYAVIKKRANRAAILGKNFLFTEAAQSLMDAAKKKDEELIHPYLELIQDSKEFTQKKFWHDISTYLDLEGVYYLMAVRAIGAPNKDGVPKVGAVQKFVMLNPYQIHRIKRESDGTVGGYVENREGMYREIPKEMIIEIRLLNPFDNELPYSMTDAAKENQFTLKQAGDYTRHSIKGNINAPGAITTDVVLEDQIFDNFVSRIQNHTKGEPLYGNGTGAVNWDAMQIDLDKAALDKINEIHRSTLFAVSGASKTMMGIEESGTGRDVSQTQKDNFTEDAVMPQIEDIIDALNLDYRKYYPEWDKDKYEICLDNPLQTDREAELKDIDIRTKEYEITNKLVSLGYEYELAAKYAHGEINLLELGEPTLEPEISDEEADAIVAQQMGQGQPNQEPQNGDKEEEQNSLRKVRAYADFLALNAKGDRYNPYRDTAGKFDDGITIAQRTRSMGKKGGNKKKLEEARKRAEAKLKEQEVVGSGTNKPLEGLEEMLAVAAKTNETVATSHSSDAWGKASNLNREAVADFLNKNGGNVEAFRSIEENWVGNDYKILENHVKNGDSKELQLMHDLQMAYFKKNNIKEVTLYRGVYNKQAKAIKAALAKGGTIDIGADFASSFTGYEQTARGYADGGAYTAPDKITDSIVIKKKFKVEDVVYSTQVSTFYAGNGDDEFIVSSPKGYKVQSADVEVIR